MFIQLDRRTVDESAEELKAVRRELESVRGSLRNGLNSLSSDTRYRSDVDGPHRRIERLLEQMEGDLEILSAFARRKAEELEQADTNGRPQWKDKLKSFLRSAGDTLTFIPKVGFHVSVGIVKGAWGMVKGIAELAYHMSPAVIAYKWMTDPQGQIEAWRMRADMIMHPGRTAKAIWDMVKTDWHTRVSGGNTASRAEYAGEMLFNIGSMFIGVGAAGAAGKAAVALNSASKAAKTAQLAKSAGYTAKLANAGTKVRDVVIQVGSRVKSAAVSRTASLGRSAVSAVQQTALATTNALSKIGRGAREGIAKLDVKGRAASLVGDPIDTGTGAQVIVQPLLTLHGASDWPFELHYNSLVLEKGVLGKGWFHTYELWLELVEEVQEPALKPSITLCRGPGRRHLFVQGEDGSYRSADEAVQFDRIVHDGEGYTLSLRESGEHYRFTSDGALAGMRNALGQWLRATQDEGRLSRLTDEVTGMSLVFAYEGDRLCRVSDGSREISLAYNESCELIRYIEPVGHAVAFTYTEAGQIRDCHIGGELHYVNTYSEQGAIIAQQDGTGRLTKLDYDETSRPDYVVTTVTDRSERTTIYVHDEKYRLVEVIRADESETYTYNEAGQVTAMENGAGEQQRVAYDAAGRVSCITDALGNETRFAYRADEDHAKPVSRTDALGGVTHYAYDEAGRLTRIVRPDGEEARATYTEHGQRLTETAFGGATTTYGYDARGRLVAVTDAEGRKTTIGYDETGRMTTFRDASGHTTTQAYDGNDNLLTVTDPLGRTWQQRYDAMDRLVEVERPSGATTRYGYGVHSAPERLVDALGAETIIERDGEGRVLQVTDAEGRHRRYGYDASGRLAYTEDGLGNRHTLAYDAAGRLKEARDALHQLTEAITYDAAGNPVAVTGASGQAATYRFNALRQATSHIDALGRETTFAYDAAQRLIETREAGAAVYRQAFGASGELLSQIDANGNETRYRYDHSGRLVEETRADGGVSAFAYDETGQLTSTTTPSGKDTTYTYDAAGQLTTQTDDAGSLSLTYDVDGRVTGIEEQGKRAERQYDANGRLTRYIDSRGYVISYVYDRSGRMTAMTYPDGKEVQYRYDAAGRLAEVRDWAGRLTRYRYDANGRLIQTDRPNRTVEQRMYSASGELTKLQDWRLPGIPLQQLTYGYNALGQIVAEGEKQYRYDELRRLVHHASPGKKSWYTYDAGGNLTETGEECAVSATNASRLTDSFTYGKDNRLRTWGDFPAEFDAEGNLLYVTDGVGVDAYEYDARNRLTTSATARYVYDAENRRIGQIEQTEQGERETQYVWDPSNALDGLDHLLMELDGDGNPCAYYVYGHGLIGREDATGRYRAYHYDARGSTTLLTDEQGQVTDRYTYGVYGEAEGHEGKTCQPYRYNGRDGVQTDADGLLYMRARYYHPRLKRFLNRDVVRGSLMDGQTFNRYAYVNGDPIGYVDPLGLCKEWSDTHKYTSAVGGTGKYRFGGSGYLQMFAAPKGTGEGLELYRRTANIGEFSHLKVPMQLREVKRLAEQAGIGLDSVKVNIIRDPEMIRLPHAGWANPNGKEIQLYPNAFMNEEQLVKTLAHERTHIFQVRLYGEAKDIPMLDKFEEGAYGIENTFWNYFNRKGK